MALSERQWQTIEKRSGVPRHVIQTMLGAGERSSQSSVSPMGAFGRAQLMPGTARAIEKRHRISTKGEFGNVLGGAFYLAEQKKRFGNWRLAFAAYNAGPGAVKQYGGVPPYKETRDYVRRTMAALGKPGGAAAGAPPDLSPAATLSDSAGMDIPHLGQAALKQIAGGAKPTEIFSDLAKELAQARRSVGLPGLPAPQQQAPVASRVPGNVILPKGADRAGMKTQADILNFAAQVAGVYGKPLKVGTGTRHSQMTVNGNVSQHWAGHAVDIPAYGKQLIRMGQAALIAAGADPKWARKQRGGLYNVGGRQVIFNTHEGGNHTNHLHLGA